MSVLEAVVHSMAYGYISAQQSGVWSIMLTGLQTGTMEWQQVSTRANTNPPPQAISILAIMICISTMPVRRRYYELFLITHTFAEILFLTFLHQQVHSPPSTIRLTVYPNTKDMGFSPGAHYFLHRWAFWEPHPFMVVAWRLASPCALEKVLRFLEQFPDSPQTTTTTTTSHTLLHHYPTTPPPP